MMGKKQSTNSASIKCVVVGDSDVGKNTLLDSYENRRLSGTKHSRRNLHVTTEDGKKISIEIEIYSGDEQSKEQREKAYETANVVVLCYAVDNLIAHQNVRTKWGPEIQQHFIRKGKHHRHLGLLLVGTKVDMRYEKLMVISQYEGSQLGKEIKADGYAEFSCWQRNTVDDVVREIIRVAKERAKRHRSKLLLCVGK